MTLENSEIFKLIVCDDEVEIFSSKIIVRCIKAFSLKCNLDVN